MGYRITLPLLQNFASQKNGSCLSTSYTNSKTKYLWQCEKTHVWSARWHQIKKGSWCPICKHSSYDIAVLQQFALNKGGILLSTSYKDNKTKLYWKCINNHTWEANWSKVNCGNTWCPTCAGNKASSIIDLQKHANSKQGLLLSTVYKNNNTALLWQCNNKHIWKATWDSIHHMNSWCPTCASLKNERRIRQELENIFNFSFTKTTIYYKNNRYQFDGYNEDHKIAFEYHGIQHYIYPNYWHKTEIDFLNAQQRDRNKEQYCIENGIRLLIVPYTNKNINEVINGL